ncbi:TolC family outer membrane protein [Xenophilus sp.]|uniref:TolC family outer membrane protein n=2 Tax=Xenophilus sp. TaxID=1873499 RepID=UPI0037DD9F96
MARRGSSAGRRLAALAFAAAALVAPPARALDLMDAWRAALEHDPAHAAALAAREAGATQARLADALWRPTVALQAGVGAASAESATRGAHFSAPGTGSSDGVAFDTSVHGGTRTQAGLELRQPLYDRQRDAQAEQLRLAVQRAELEWSDAQAALMLRTAERYFDLALAAEQLRLIERQLEAVTRARVEAQDRFELGDKPITDVHEAAARAEGLRAQRLAAQAQVELRRAALADLTGLPPGEIADLALPAGLPADGEAGDLIEWLGRVAQHSPVVRQAVLRLHGAEQEARKTDLPLSPVVDLVARAGRERLSGSGDFGRASQRQTQASVGVQLTLPLYTGGARSARQDEAVARVAQAQAELDRARQEALQQARAAWLGVSVGRGQAAALAAAVRAGDARLDATRTGREAGDRTTLDLLNAENDAAAARLALAQARVQVQLDGLRLARLAGALDAPRLHRLADALGPGRAPAD